MSSCELKISAFVVLLNTRNDNNKKKITITCLGILMNLHQNFNEINKKYFMCITIYFCSLQSSNDIEDQRRREAANVFRNRHHISQEDNLSVQGSMEDISGIVGRVEAPAVVRNNSVYGHCRNNYLSTKC